MWSDDANLLLIDFIKKLSAKRIVIKVFKALIKIILIHYQ